MILEDIYSQFPEHADCIDLLEEAHWGKVPACPYCGSGNESTLPKEHRHHCNNCNTTYSVTVGTIFHNTKVDLQKWFGAIILVMEGKKGLPVRKLAQEIQVNKNTAWYMTARIEKAAQTDSELLQKIIEAVLPVSATN